MYHLQKKILGDIHEMESLIKILRILEVLGLAGDHQFKQIVKHFQGIDKIEARIANLLTYQI